jgi:5-(aminomethyl)-3-furanmethanol phosphate kinase
MTSVVKLGGSLADDPLLKDWLATLAECGSGRMVIVPGGGPFADQVREAQRRWRFGEATAHRMAILAMDQYGQMLAGIRPELTLAASIEAISAALAANRVAIWLPARMTLEDGTIEASWDVTSDSLAAWLAKEIGATRLVLVKSRVAPDLVADLDRLVQHGIVDKAFPAFARAARITVSLVGKADFAKFPNSERRTA